MLGDFAIPRGYQCTYCIYNQIRKPESSWPRGRWGVRGIKCLFTRYSPVVVPEGTLPGPGDSRDQWAH